MGSIVIDDVLVFLSKVPPFQFLDPEMIQFVAKGLSMEFYPRDTVILRQDGPPSDSLRIIKKGAVKVSMRSEEGEEIVIDYRGEGDNFGFLSLIGKDKQRTTIVAIDDTICYLVSKETILKLLESNPAFTEYFLHAHLAKYIHRTYGEMHSKSSGYESSDQFLFRTQVGDLATKEVVTIYEDTSIQEAAQIMSKHKISSLVVVNQGNLPSGILTDRDLREKVVAKGRDVNDPVGSIMSLPLIRVDARDFCFEAVLKMIRYNIHHILVIKDGMLQGVLTNHDLMMLQGTSPLSFARDIENQQSIDGLVPVSQKINNMIRLLLREGARASNITRIISEINDRLVRKVLEIAEKKFGDPPVPYCWVALGSEGRKEQTFKTDQDNAIIYADPVSAAQALEAKAYFAEFTIFVRDGLIRCGFPLCLAGYMASTPQWCQPLKEWKRYFLNWTSIPSPDAVLKSLIFFDFRPLHGEYALADELRDATISMVNDSKVFLGYIANMAIRNRPPIGFLKTFVVEKSGEHKDELNLKVKGIAPIVDMARLFSLERGVKETSTLERIAALKETHTIVKEYAEELEHAFEFIMLLRIHHQFRQIEDNKTPDNFINPNALSTLEKRTLKDAFHLISQVQDLIIERYKPFIL